MNLESAVSLLQDYPAVSDAHMLTMLQALEIPEQTAWEMVVMIPLAYLRELVRKTGIQFADCLLLCGDDEVHEIALDDQAVYRGARGQAARDLARGMPQEQLMAVILRSREFHLVNQAMLEERDLSEISLDPIEIAPELSEHSPLAPPREEPEGDAPSPWWQFWR